MADAKTPGRFCKMVDSMKLCAVALAMALSCAAAAPDVKGNAFGNPSAPITLEIFSDFECPACKNLHETMVPQLMRDFVIPGKVYLIQRYFPWQGHQYGRISAEYVCAAAQIGKYDQVANAMFASQAGWSMTGDVEGVVKRALTPAEARKVKSLLKDPAVQGQIDRDLAEGRTIPLQQTPTILITKSMRRYPIAGLSDYGLIKSFLNDLLKK